MWSEVAQSCPTLCYPVECSPPGSSVYGIFHARILEWVAVSFSRGSSQPRDRTQVSCITGRCFNLWATREALGHMVVLFLVFKESSILFSIVTVSICSYHISHGKAHFSPSTLWELLWLLFGHYVMTSSFDTLWTIACQAPLSMELPRQQHWIGLPFPSPGDLPDPGIKPSSPLLAGRFFTTEPQGKSILWENRCFYAS